MSDEILINCMPQETRVAIVENGVLQEVHIERDNEQGLVGVIFKGIVARVLPGMQAAFIELGLEKTGFLHVSDVVPLVEKDSEEEEAPPLPDIQSLLYEGQKILVQVVKDPMGTKGARLTTHLSIASRCLVYMPDLARIGVSQRIEGEEERERLRGLLAGHLPEDEAKGYIVRTAAEGMDERTILADCAFLKHMWQKLSERVHALEAPQVVFRELPLAIRSLRDFMRPGYKLRIDTQEGYQKLCEFSEAYVPEARMQLHYYVGERPIFDLYNVEREIGLALQRKVILKSGGHLVFDQTEAMTTIDVNTGGFVGHKNLEETIFKTNMEAAVSIGHQLRLRNLGGIIIIDFIDMEKEEHKQLVLEALEKSFDKDHAKITISGVSSLGLVEMTRKRTRDSLRNTLCQPCPLCEGRGSIKTIETICYEICREIFREVKTYNASGYLVLAAQNVVDYMLDEGSSHLAELETQIAKPVRLQGEALYTQEQFDIVLV
ncbi:ribonuclease G [Piscirickettsia litoralis]|uniref:Ribonuclease G n=1 Tax=Piscirickettsia litoralis TaxID=1891921 RepID=A0ABX3A283_9GAMM|nr:ribonuclease G [Piscirickettsia litoralis]ODN42600.1 ribonuclease G [Piscirickettsia litoralis]